LWLDLMIFKVFSNLSNSVTLWFYEIKAILYMYVCIYTQNYLQFPRRTINLMRHAWIFFSLSPMSALLPASPLLTRLLGIAFTRAGKMECCLSYSDATTEYDLWKTVRFARSVSVIGLVSKLQRNQGSYRFISKYVHYA